MKTDVNCARPHRHSTKYLQTLLYLPGHRFNGKYWDLVVNIVTWLFHYSLITLFCGMSLCWKFMGQLVCGYWIEKFRCLKTPEHTIIIHSSSIFPGLSNSLICYGYHMRCQDMHLKNSVLWTPWEGICIQYERVQTTSKEYIKDISEKSFYRKIIGNT